MTQQEKKIFAYIVFLRFFFFTFDKIIITWLSFNAVITMVWFPKTGPSKRPVKCLPVKCAYANLGQHLYNPIKFL